jgi:glycosyltransferase involved in cell wall biosynthesis
MALEKRDHCVTVVYTKPPWETIEVPDLPYRIVWATLPAFSSCRRASLRGLSSISVARQVAHLLDDAEVPSVVHAQGEEGAILPWICSRRNTPLIATPRYPDYPEVLTPNAPTPTRRALNHTYAVLFHAKYLLLGVLLKRATRVSTTSDSAATKVSSIYNLPPHQTVVIPNGVSPVFQDVADTPYCPDGPLLFFGRLARSKGVDVLIDALTRLRQHDVYRPCVIAGRGPMEASLRQTITSRGLEDQIHFVGWRSSSSLAELLSQSSMAVLPSREESFGNAMAESMAAGIPVISTRAGSIPEIVDHEQTGLLVPQNDAEALAQEIHHLLEAPDKAERLGTAGTRYINDTLTWTNAAKQFERIFESCQ